MCLKARLRSVLIPLGQKHRDRKQDDQALRPIPRRFSTIG
jgi:hypothetical protein